MKTLPTKALLLGLAVAMTPALRAADAPPLADTKIDNASSVLDASFDSLSKTLNDARNQVVEAVEQRNLALMELQARRDSQAETMRELAALKKQLQVTQRSEAQWKSQSEKLSKKLAAGPEAHAKLASFRDQMDGALKEFSSLQKDIASVRSELQAPAERISLRKENAGLKQAKASLEGELKKEATRFKQLGSRLAAETLSHQQTSQKLVNSTRECAKLSNQLATASKGNSELEKQAAVAKRERQALSASNRELQTKTASLQKAGALVQHQLANTSAELKSSVAAHQKLDAQFAAARKTSGEQLASAHKTIKQAQGTLTQLGEKHKALHVIASGTATALKKTQQQVVTEKGARSKVEQLQAATAKQAAELSAQLKANGKALATIEDELASSQEALAEVSKHTGILRKVAEHTAVQFKQAKQQAATSEKARHQAEQARNETAKNVTALTVKLEVSGNDLTRAQGQIKKANAELSSIRKDTDELRQIAGVTSGKLKQAKQQTETVRTEMLRAKEANTKASKELSSRLEQTSNELGTAKTQQQQTASKLNEVSAQLKQAQQAKATADKALKERDARIAQLQASIEKQRSRETAKIDNSAE